MGALVVIAMELFRCCHCFEVLPRVDAVPVEMATRRHGMNRRACKSDTTRSEAMSFGPDLQDDHTVKRGKQEQKRVRNTE
ncbi:hypothetical protein EDB86DRAFT_2917719 [Lactarius hatsudake]|nr:hypothetical protein EDB86DRAFT_2917719 [Lactarius hatsudake]